MKNIILFSLLLMMSLSQAQSPVTPAADAATVAVAEPFFHLQGSGGFTIDGSEYRHFAFYIVCKTGDDCMGSYIDIGGLHVPVTMVSYSTIDGSRVILVESSSLQCNVFDFGSTKTSEMVVFDCLRPFGSGISTDALLQED
ncbi:MAG: hypothetical protein ACRDFB_05895 [Rhabdochlamydiaceae bacterium]